MAFDEPHRIDFTHDPALKYAETAGVVGYYALTPHPVGTTSTSTPSPSTRSLPGSCVQTAAMRGVIAIMGQRFGHNLLAHPARRTPDPARHPKRAPTGGMGTPHIVA